MMLILLIGAAFAGYTRLTTDDSDSTQCDGGKVNKGICSCDSSSTRVMGGDVSNVGAVIACHKGSKEHQCPDHHLYVSPIFSKAYCVQCKENHGVATYSSIWTKKASMCEPLSENSGASNCRAGEHFSRHFSYSFWGSKTDHSVCQKCARGYGSEAGAHTCTACEYGFEDREGVCKPCLPGTVATSKGFCGLCELGTVSSADGVCKECPENEVPNFQRSRCVSSCEVVETIDYDGGNRIELKRKSSDVKECRFCDIGQFNNGHDDSAKSCQSCDTVLTADQNHPNRCKCKEGLQGSSAGHDGYLPGFSLPFKADCDQCASGYYEKDNQCKPLQGV